MSRIIVRLGIFLCLVLSAVGLALKAGARESSSYLLAFYALPVALSSGPVYVVVRDRDINLVLSRDAYTYGELAWSPDGTRLAFNANECSGVCIKFSFTGGAPLI